MSENIKVIPIWRLFDGSDPSLFCNLLPSYNEDLKSNVIFRFSKCLKCKSQYCKRGTIWKKNDGIKIIDTDEECCEIKSEDENWQTRNNKRKNIGDDIKPFTRFPNEYSHDYFVSKTENDLNELTHEKPIRPSRELTQSPKSTHPPWKKKRRNSTKKSFDEWIKIRLENEK